MHLGCALFLRGLRRTDLHQFATASFSGPPARRFAHAAKAVEYRAYSYRCFHQVANFHWPGHLHSLCVMQSGGNHATALLAVWRASKDARLDSGLQVRGIVRRHLCKQALLRIARWLQQGLRYARAHEKLRIAFPQWRQDPRQHRAIFRSEHFSSIFTLLRSVETYPDTVHFPARTPEGHVLFQIPWTLRHRPRDGPVNIDFALTNIFENAVIGGRFAPFIMMLGKPVHRHRYPATR